MGYERGLRDTATEREREKKRRGGEKEGGRWTGGKGGGGGGGEDPPDGGGTFLGHVSSEIVRRMRGNCTDQCCQSAYFSAA